MTNAVLIQLRGVNVDDCGVSNAVLVEANPLTTNAVLLKLGGGLNQVASGWVELG